MNKHFLAAALAATTLCGAASAQSTLDATPTDIAIRAGGFFPFDEDLRDVNDSWFGFGIDILFSKQYLANSRTYLSVDWIGKSLKGSKGNIFPICLNQKFWIGDQGADGPKMYIFGGIGATIFDIYSTDTQFGLRAGAGMDLGPNIFAEGTLFWSDKSTGGVEGTGLGLYLGYRW